MPITRNNLLPQHSYGSGAHYGSLPLAAFPSGSDGDILYYSGSSGVPILTALSGLTVVTSGSGGPVAAADVSITDAGGYFTGTDVEAALQELGAKTLGVKAHGDTGSTETFDASEAGWHTATLDGDSTFTFDGATDGVLASMVLELLQDSTGSRTVTWPASVVWPADTAPTLSTAGGATDILTFFSRDGGMTWYGFLAGGGPGSSVESLDDLSDVTITSAAEGDILRHNGTAFVNSALRWEPVTTDPGTGPEIVFTATDIVMTWADYS